MTYETVAIGEQIMLEATLGHVHRLRSPESITEAFIELDASPDEIGVVLKTLAGIRNDGSTENFDTRLYHAAMLDGVLIGLRAARIAERRAHGIENEASADG